ncbi:molybdate ABC transporter substrate-binding protein [Paenibacillus silvisoli]|uniref:molybdate ABC transporter substrate-binding protein n=1 Tax=Paenibacillus silvisoli TaxID=3110539 RepID=UPI00280583D1|nr:molybdate ABC transporter substrate-binding protein [Paenibacillus silvisoli]
MKLRLRITTIIAIIAASIALTACGGNNQPQADKQTELTVSAAASLKDALTALKSSYEEQNKNIRITFNFGSSGTLQKQIEQGAPVDLYVSAAQKQMDALHEKGLVGESPILLRNELVLIVPKDNTTAVPTDLSALQDADYGKIAIGEPDSVPVGAYIEQSLTAAGLWDILKPKLIYAKDVRQVLSYVETGNVDAGFVYATDAKTSSGVNTAFTIAEETHKPIVYPAAVIQGSEHEKQAEELLAYLQSAEAAPTWTSYGFLLP